jgi:hypothetical protein
MKTLLPDPGQFDPTETRPNSNLGPIADQDIKVLPVWKPDAPNKDAMLVRIADENTNGDYTAAHNSSNPHVLEEIAGPGHAESDAIHGATPLQPRRHPYEP